MRRIRSLSSSPIGQRNSSTDHEVREVCRELQVGERVEQLQGEAKVCGHPPAMVLEVQRHSCPVGELLPLEEIGDALERRERANVRLKIHMVEAGNADVVDQRERLLEVLDAGREADRDPAETVLGRCADDRRRNSASPHETPTPSNPAAAIVATRASGVVPWRGRGPPSPTSPGKRGGGRPPWRPLAPARQRGLRSRCGRRRRCPAQHGKVAEPT